MNIRKLLIIAREYKPSWIVYRGLYSLKLYALRRIPAIESVFEKNVHQVVNLELLSFDIKMISDFLSGLPYKDKEILITNADKAAEGKITTFSSQLLDYGNPINWHFNPLTGAQESRNKKWYLIDDFDLKRGDIKLIWEPSRFTHFFLFARAYLLTRDMKYYSAFSDQLDEWLKENVYSYGANYKCGQECGLRMINACIVYEIFRTCGLTTNKDTENIKKLVLDSYRKIRSNFFYAHRCIKNNHTLSELCGMITGAWFCGQPQVLKKAAVLLNREIHRQFMDDGGYIQYSVTYQRFALQLMEYILKIDPVIGHILDAESKDRIRRSTQLLYQIQDENGDVPNYGSNDGALIFPLHACGYRDFRPVIQCLERQLNNRRVFAEGPYDEESLWFQNQTGSLAFSSPLIITERKSMSFQDSGYYILRRSTGFAVVCLQNYKTRPAHMDQLHLDIWHQGINLFCDTGTYSYAEEAGNILSSTGGHNTVRVDGKEQMSKTGHFLLYNWPKTKLAAFHNTIFEGILFSRNGYIHDRKVVMECYGYRVIDRIHPKHTHYEVLFHTPCHPVLNENKVILEWRGERIAELIIEGGIPVLASFYRSLYYMRKERIFEIKLKAEQDTVITKIILIGGEHD